MLGSGSDWVGTEGAVLAVLELTVPAMRRSALTTVVLVALMGYLTIAQEPGTGRSALSAFRAWKGDPANASLKWVDALAKYRAKLRRDGLSEEAVETALQLVMAYDEGDLYDKIYGGEPPFNTKPNSFLVEVVAGLEPGKALDVGMGMGRNAVYLAGLGWEVTGFDVSEVGLQKAREQARASGLVVTAVHSADVDFPFGREQWDLIVIVYALEKRSVHKVRDALRPGGHVLVVASHREPGGNAVAYESNELLEIFAGFRIFRYEEVMENHDFGKDRNKAQRLVRVLAQKH